MKLIGNVRLGRDAELRHVGNNQTAVATLFGAYNYGKKVDGKRPTQWVEATLWGQQAEALEQYLVKGEQFLLTLNDVHISEYQKNDGTTGTKLCGTIKDIDFVGGSANNREASPQRQAEPRRAAPAKANTGGFDDMADDIPF